MGPNYKLLTLTVVATEALRAGRAIGLDGAESSSWGGPAIGFCDDDTGSGEPAPVVVGGVTSATAGSDVEKGEFVQLDGEGRVIPHMGGHIVGLAMSAADAADDSISVLVLQGTADESFRPSVTPAGGVLEGQAAAVDGSLASAGDPIWGVFQEGGAEGDTVPVRMFGRVRALSGGAVTAGSEIEVGAAAKFVNQSAGTVVGIAETGTSGADEQFWLVLR